MPIRRLPKRRNLADSRLLVAGILGLGCGQILDISEPRPRPPLAIGGQGGQAAEPSVAGSSAARSPWAAPSRACQRRVLVARRSAARANPGPAATSRSAALEIRLGNLAWEPVAARVAGGLLAVRRRHARSQSSAAIRIRRRHRRCATLSDNGSENSAEGNGLDCPTECDPSSGKCVECEGSESTCNGNYLNTCVNGAWSQAPQPCAEFCKQGACVNVPSCSDPPQICGAESCCLSLNVDGGTFARDGDAKHMATITSFSMDKYDVTVARLIRYYNWLYSSAGAPPAAGAGKSPHIAADSGWDVNYPLPATSQDMQAMLSCPIDGGGTDDNATFLDLDQALPANCVSYYVAYAFCIWDGGRLPTEAEWNYAAAGGTDERYYPWSNPFSSTSIDATRAVYLGSGSPSPVGSVPAGNGKYGQADLEGNVADWMLDYSDPYPDPCVDCLGTTVSDTRAVRGGSFLSPVPVLKVARRSNADPAVPKADIGFRCVHDL